MNRKVVFCISILVSALALSAFAQQDPGTITRGFRIKVKPGMAKQFEEAYKKHIAWHEQHKDTWFWDAYLIESGDRIGEYVVITGDHHWSDFDNRGDMGKADSADFAANGQQYVESTEGWYSRMHPSLSRIPKDMGESYPILRVTNYSLKGSHVENFKHVFAKYSKACEKTDRPNHFVVIENLTGEDQPSFTVVGMEKSWAGMKPVEQSVGEMMREVYGSAEAESSRKMFFDAIRSQRTDMVRHLPELSYRPPSRPTTDE
jgi:hypothetical protein